MCTSPKTGARFWPHRLTLMLLLTLPFTATGCANPGPPKPPSLRLPAPAKDLRADRIGNEVHLSWTTLRRNHRRHRQQATALRRDLPRSASPVRSSPLHRRPTPLRHSWSQLRRGSSSTSPAARPRSRPPLPGSSAQLLRPRGRPLEHRLRRSRRRPRLGRRSARRSLRRRNPHPLVARQLARRSRPACPIHPTPSCAAPDSPESRIRPSPPQSLRARSTASRFPGPRPRRNPRSLEPAQTSHIPTSPGVPALSSPAARPSTCAARTHPHSPSQFTT